MVAAHRIILFCPCQFHEVKRAFPVVSARPDMGMNQVLRLVLRACWFPKKLGARVSMLTKL